MATNTGATSEGGKESLDFPEMDWMPPPPENKGNRFWIKMKENPFVPIGRCVTCVGVACTKSLSCMHVS